MLWTRHNSSQAGVLPLIDDFPGVFKRPGHLERGVIAPHPDLMISLPTENWLRLAAWLLIGLTVYFLYGRRHSILTRNISIEHEDSTLSHPLVKEESAVP